MAPALSFDWRLLLFTCAITIATAVLFGTIPALRASNAPPIGALNEKGRGFAGRTPGRLSDGMVIAQVALAVIVVVGAGLFVRTFAALATMPLGFETSRVLLVNMNLARSQEMGDRIELVHRIVREVAGVPGVAKAAASVNTPVSGLGMVDLVHTPGRAGAFRPMIDGKLGPHSTYGNYITPGWFATYGTPLRAGRDFTDRDVKGAPPVIIVNEAFARKFLVGKDPVGATVAFERGLQAPVVKTVVGVVSDAVYDSLRNEVVATEYAPLAQLEFPGPGPVDVSINVLAVRGDPMLLARSVGEAITTTEPDVSFAFRAMTDQVSASLTQERLIAMLSAFFGALALLLAGLGLYGMMSYAVVCRRGEVGVRLALGSTGAKIVWLVVARAARIVAAGIVIGGIASTWASKLVATLVFRIDPQDPVTLAGAAVTLAVVATAAAWLPAHRASRLDPATMMREN